MTKMQEIVQISNQHNEKPLLRERRQKASYLEDFSITISQTGNFYGEYMLRVRLNHAFLVSTQFITISEIIMKILCN